MLDIAEREHKKLQKIYQKFSVFFIDKKICCVRIFIMKNGIGRHKCFKICNKEICDVILQITSNFM